MFKYLIRGGILAVMVLLGAAVAQAAPYAALVMDARTGEVLHARNADARLHPASLTKMMTLYIVFAEIKAGRMSLDQMVTISANAAAEPPSHLGLRAGQRIALRYLIRAAAIKSANDAATALGEAVSGSESRFASYMNEVAAMMGMHNTHFVNAHGLTATGHYSSARDMAILGRRLFYDHPEYYNLFSRLSANAGIATVRHTNRRFLNDYEGADGIKTGFTNASGYNLVASARHGGKRLIAVVFGGRSTVTRNNRVAELLDMGFGMVPERAAVVPLPPIYLNGHGARRGSGVVRFVERPVLRPFPGENQIADSINEALQLAQVEALVDEIATQEQTDMVARLSTEVPPMQRPIRRPFLGNSVALEAVAPEPEMAATTRVTALSGGGNYAVQVGAFRLRGQAERLLIQTALVDLESFGDARQSIEPAMIQGVSMYQARFVGMSADTAEKACARLQALQSDCTIIAPAN